jgi:tetratricopeptide (TPR) repeat protein
MARRKRRKSKSKPLDHSQKMSHLKAKALRQVAQQASELQQHYKTIALLTDALRREPANPDILIKLATAYGKQRHYEKAEELLARLVQLAPRKASNHRRIAQVYVTIDRPERAMESYRRSLELNRDTSATVPTLLELAKLYERRHQLDEARAVVAEALEREPDNEAARLEQALLLRRSGETAQAEAGLRTLVGDLSCNWLIRTQAWYELAQLLDDEQQYDDAFAALLEAKQLFKPYASPYLSASRETLVKNQQLLNILDKSCFERWKEVAEQDTPYRFAVLTSHPRSGTTLVEQVLDSHEELISADEFDVFSQWIHAPIFRKFRYSTPILTVLDHVPPGVRQQARATYWQQTEAIFDRSIGDRMLLDKNPGMMILLPTVNWAFPEMKILVALRDPRDVILSCFMQKVPLTPISCHWLSIADAADYYARVMRTWLTVRPLTPSPWLEFRYEDAVADLETSARRILEFLGLPWNEGVLRFYEHAREKIIRSPTYKDVTQPVYHRSVGRWQHYARHLEPILEQLQPFLKEFGYADD